MSGRDARKVSWPDFSGGPQVPVQVNQTEDLLERGFQLAYFIFPSRSQAVRILSGAVNKLKAQRGRESRRVYWRDKYLKRAITRITREEGDMLQWLIFYESDQYEKEQEASPEYSGARATLQDMLLRYIKSLVRMTSAMSSFHVNIGLHRLLHNYSTAEIQQVYESVTDRYLGADEYRRAKSVLMGRLEERFGAMLKTCRTQHGELRFESADEQARWAELVDLCLQEFTPWSTRNACPVPSNFDGAEKTLPSRLSGQGASEADMNQVEMNRCHVFIDPVCYGRLVRALSIEPPSRKLDLPRFFMQNSDTTNRSDQPPLPPGLSADERKSVTDYASAQAQQRHKATPTAITIVVDGKERARLDLSRTTGKHFEVSEGAELIEVWEDAAKNAAPLLLATHRIAYSQTQGFAPDLFSIGFKDGAELVFQLSGVDDAPDGARTAMVSLVYRPSPSRATGSWKWLSATPKFALASAMLAGLGLGLGWLLGTVPRQQKLSGQPPSLYVENTAPQSTATPKPSELAQAHEVSATYRLVSDDLATRGNGGADMPSVGVPGRPVLVQLELPVAAAEAHKVFRATLKTFLKDEEILSENKLKAHKDASGVTVVTFELPTTFLEVNTDYTVDLRSLSASGAPAEASTYTFHTVKSLK